MVVHTHQPQEHSKGCIVCLLLQNCSNAVPDDAHVEPLEVVMPGWTGVRVPHKDQPSIVCYRAGYVSNCIPVALQQLKQPWASPQASRPVTK